MNLVIITFEDNNVVLTEGLLQMLDKQIAANAFIFEVEYEEIEMLISEIEEVIDSPIVEVIVEHENE